MAMGNLCYEKLIECEYATSLGLCLDDIHCDFGLCIIEGDDMPPKHLPTKERQIVAMKILRSNKTNI